MIHYELINTTRQSVLTNAVESGLKAAEKKVGDLSHQFVSIEFVSPKQSQAANKALRGVDLATDCISLSTVERTIGEQIIHHHRDGSLDFELKKEAKDTPTWPVIGQLIVCLSEVAKNAHQAGQPVERELEWVIEHGVLHLMGYHHAH